MIDLPRISFTAIVAFFSCKVGVWLIYHVIQVNLIIDYSIISNNISQLMNDLVT